MRRAATTFGAISRSIGRRGRLGQPARQARVARLKPRLGSAAKSGSNAPVYVQCRVASSLARVPAEAAAVVVVAGEVPVGVEGGAEEEGEGEGE